MMYSRRHYTALAKIIAELRTSALDRGDLFLLETMDMLRVRLSDTFAKDNPSFSVTRFQSACESTAPTKRIRG